MDPCCMITTYDYNYVRCQYIIFIRIHDCPISITVDSTFGVCVGGGRQHRSIM